MAPQTAPQPSPATPKPHSGHPPDSQPGPAAPQPFRLSHKLPHHPNLPRGPAAPGLPPPTPPSQPPSPAADPLTSIRPMPRQIPTTVTRFSASQPLTPSAQPCRERGDNLGGCLEPPGHNPPVALHSPRAPGPPPEPPVLCLTMGKMSWEAAMGQRPWGSAGGEPCVPLGASASRQEQAMTPSPSPGGPSGRFQSWGPFQPQQASWGQVVSGVAVRLGGPPGPCEVSPAAGRHPSSHGGPRVVPGLGTPGSTPARRWPPWQPAAGGVSTALSGCSITPRLCPTAPVFPHSPAPWPQCSPIALPYGPSVPPWPPPPPALPAPPAVPHSQ